MDQLWWEGMWRGSDACEEWRRKYWESLVRRTMIHTWQSPSVLYCSMFLLQTVFQCTCIRYNLVLFAAFFSLMFWVSHLINQDNATAFCIIRKYLLCCKAFELAPAKRAHWSTYQLMSQCCPLLLHYSLHCSCTDINFLCVRLREWNWECYGLLVMKYGGSTHYWMQYSDIN